MPVMKCAHGRHERNFFAFAPKAFDSLAQAGDRAHDGQSIRH
jgi:hypothetical protein